MRGLRSTIALVVVLAGLSAYIYFVTWKKPAAPPEGTKEKVFAALTADAIDEITVKSESGDTTTVKKDGTAWKMTSPLMVGGDDTDIGAITTNLSSLDIVRVVDEKPTDLKEYGLDAPRIEVRFKAAGDKGGSESAHTLVIGGRSPTGGDLFARRDNDARVILIGGFTEPIFNRTTFDLREKTLLKFDRDKIDRIDMTADKNTIELTKQGNDWSITKPSAMPAEFSSVDSLIGRIQTAALKSFATEQATPADLKKYGFDKPQGSLVLDAAGMPVSLIVGGKVDDNDVYVRDPARPFIAVIDGSFLKELQKGTDEYRRKAVFEMRGFTTDRLEFVRDGQTIAFERVKTQEQAVDKWKRVSPNPGDPDATKMESLLAKLENLRAASFQDSAANTGLDKPSLTIDAKSEGGKMDEHATFVKNGTDVFGAKAGQPGAFKVATGEFDDMVKALDEVAK